MRRLNKEITSKNTLSFIEAKLKILPSKNHFKKIQINLLHKAMRGCEKSKELLNISKTHAHQMEKLV